MPAEREVPDAIVAATNYPTTPVSSLQDDPATPDANWINYTSNSTNGSLRVSFPTPTRSLSGTQTVRVLVQGDANSSNSTPSVLISLYENGTSKATLVSATSVTTGNLILTGTFDPSVLSDPTGAGVEVFVSVSSGTGNPSNRGNVNIGAISWDAQIVGPPAIPTPATIPTISAINGPGGVLTSAVVLPGTISTVSATKIPIINFGNTAQPGSISTTTLIGAPSEVFEAGVGPATTTQVPTPNISAGSRISVGSIATVTSIVAPTTHTDWKVAASTVVTASVIGTASLVAVTRVVPTTIQTWAAVAGAFVTPDVAGGALWRDIEFVDNTWAKVDATGSWNNLAKFVGTVPQHIFTQTYVQESVPFFTPSRVDAGTAPSSITTTSAFGSVFFRADARPVPTTINTSSRVRGRQRTVIIGNHQGSATSLARYLADLGFDVTVDTTITDISQLSNYDIIANDGYVWSLDTPGLLQQAYDAGYQIFSTGNDTTAGQLPFATNSVGVSLQPWSIHNEGVIHPINDGTWGDVSQSGDSGQGITAVRASCVVLATMSSSVGTLEVVLAEENPNGSGGRWVHIQWIQNAESLVGASFRWLAGTETTPSTGSKTAPAAVTTTSTVGGITFSADTTPRPSVLGTVSSIPVLITKLDAVVARPSHPTTSAVGLPTFMAGAAPTPARAVTTSVVQSQGIKASATSSPITAATHSIVLQTSISATTVKGPIVTVTSIGSPTLNYGNASIPATTLTTSVVGIPSAQAGASTTPSTVITAATVSAPKPYANATPTTTTVVTSSLVEVPVVIAQTRAFPASIATVTSVAAPTLKSSSTPTPNPAVTVAAVQVPRLSATTVKGPIQTTTAFGTVRINTSARAVVIGVTTSTSVGSIAFQSAATTRPASISTTSTVSQPSPTAQSNFPVYTIPTASSFTLPVIGIGTGPVPTTAITTGTVEVSDVIAVTTALVGTVKTTTPVYAPALHTGATPVPAGIVTTASVQPVDRIVAGTGVVIPVSTISTLSVALSPSLGASSTAVPATIAMNTSVGVPTTDVGQTLSPGTVQTSSLVQFPGSPFITATAKPSVINTLTAIITPSLGFGTGPTAVTIVTTSSVPAANAYTGVFTIVPVSPIRTTSNVKAPTLRTGIATAPASINTRNTVEVPELVVAENAKPSTLHMVSAVQPVTLVVGQTLAPAVINTASEVKEPTLHTGALPTPTVLSTSASVGVPVISSTVLTTPTGISTITVVSVPFTQAGTSTVVQTVVTKSNVYGPNIYISIPEVIELQADFSPVIALNAVSAQVVNMLADYSPILTLAAFRAAVISLNAAFNQMIELEAQYEEPPPVTTIMSESINATAGVM